MFSKKAITTTQTAIIIAIIIIAAAGVWYVTRPTPTPSPSPSPSPTPSPTPEEPQVITLGTNQDIDNLDPHYTVKNVEMRLTYIIYDGLLHYGKDPEKVEPSLATDWTISEDATEYTFTLRQGVTFEDGSPLNAEAVKFSFERLMGVSAGPAEPFGALDHVEAVDEYTVKFVLSRPFAPFLWTLASNFARIVPPSVMEHEVEGDWGQAWLSDHSLGTGPFKIEEFLRGESVTLVRNDDYWGEAPQLEKVTARIIPEPSTLRMELEAGTIDMTEGIILEDIEELQANPDINVFESLGVGTTFLYFHTQTAPFDDRNVRLAIAHAIDYDDIIEGPMKGYAQQIQGPIPIGMWGRPDLPLYERDLDKAKQLLDDAGYKDGFSATFSLSPLADWPDIAVLIQEDLAEIGIELELKQYDWSRYVDLFLGGEVEFGIIGITPDYPDPDMWIWFLMYSESPLNIAFYYDETVDTLVSDGRRITDMDERIPIYEELQTIVHEEAIYIYLYQPTFFQPMRTWVKGYYFNPVMMPRIPFNDMWIEK